MLYMKNTNIIHIKPEVTGFWYKRIRGSGRSAKDSKEISHDVTVKLGPKIERIAPPPNPAASTSVRTNSVLTKRNGAAIATRVAPIKTKLPVADSRPQNIADMHVSTPIGRRLRVKPSHKLSHGE